MGDLQGKPEQILEKIVTGRVEKAMKAKLLIEQPYIRDTNMSVDELVKTYIAKLGENIQIARFVRFNVGELQSADPEERTVGPPLTHSTPTHTPAPSARSFSS